MTQAEAKRAERASAARVLRGDLVGLDTLDADALGVFCFADVRPLAGVAAFLDWRLCGALSHAMERGLFSGAAADTMLLPAFGRPRVKRVFAFGLGPVAQASTTLFARVSEEATAVMHKAGVRKVVLAAPAVRRKPDIETMFVNAATSHKDLLVLVETERKSP